MVISCAGDLQVSHGISLSDSMVRTILDLYQPEYRFVSKAVLADLSLRCEVLPARYPYTQTQVFEYVTAPAATLIVCQLAYVLVGGLIATENPVVRPCISWDQFVQLRDAALLRFTRYEARFHAEVPNRVPIPCMIAMGKTKHLNSCLHCVMSFEIGNGIFGEVRSAVVRGTK